MKEKENMNMRKPCKVGRRCKHTYLELTNTLENLERLGCNIWIDYARYKEFPCNCMIQNRFADIRFENIFHLLLGEMEFLYDYKESLKLCVFKHGSRHGVNIFKDREYICGFSLEIGNLPNSKKYIINLHLISIVEKFQNKGIGKSIIYGLLLSADILQVDMVCNHRFAKSLLKRGFIPREDVSDVFNEEMSYIERCGNDFDKDMVFINIKKGVV